MNLTVQDASMINAILWAIESPGEVKFAEPSDPIRYADLLRAHRITGRFAHRREQTKTRISSRLMRRVEEDLAEVATSIMREQQRLQLLDESFEGYPGPQPIVIKGNVSAYILERPELQRATGDTDLLVASTDNESEWLRERDFIQRVDRMPHEIRPLIFGKRVRVDLHAYFPAWRVPREVPGDLLDAPHRATSWVESSRLNYQSVHDGAVRHPLAPCGNLLMPCMEVDALILALHMFHDAVELCPNPRRPRIRLIEVAELRDLLSAQGFDHQKLADLVSVSGAQDAWASVQQLLAAINNSGTSDPRQPVEIAAIQQAEWGILWQADGTLADLLLWPSNGLPHMGYKFGAESVNLRADQAWWTTHTGLSGKQVAHALVSGGEDSDFGFRFKFDVDNSGITLVVETLGGPGPFLEEVTIRFPEGSIYAAWEVSRNSYRLDAEGLPVSASWEILERGWRCRIKVPIESAKVLFNGKASVHSYLSCVSFRAPVGDDWSEFYRRGVLSALAIMRLTI